MAKPNEAAVLERAKKLCKEDGFLEFKMPLPKYSKVVLRQVLEREARQKYLAHARQELLNECGDCA